MELWGTNGDIARLLKHANFSLSLTYLLIQLTLSCWMNMYCAKWMSLIYRPVCWILVFTLQDIAQSNIYTILDLLENVMMEYRQKLCFPNLLITAAENCWGSNDAKFRSKFDIWPQCNYIGVKCRAVKFRGTYFSAIPMFPKDWCEIYITSSNMSCTYFFGKFCTYFSEFWPCI